MFNVVQFKKEHLKVMITQDINKVIEDCMTSGLANQFERSLSATFMKKDKPLACAGISKVWPGRGHLWCVFDETSKADFLPLMRGAYSWLDNMSKMFPRIELSVDHGPFHEVASKRAEMLGFKLECSEAKKYLPNGESASIYSRTV